MPSPDQWNPPWLQQWLESDDAKALPPDELRTHMIYLLQRMQDMQLSEVALADANVNAAMLMSELEGTRMASDENLANFQQQQIENKRLQEAVQMNHAVIESVAEPLMLLDSTMRVQMMNRAAKKFFVPKKENLRLGELIRGISVGKKKAKEHSFALVNGEQIPVRCEVNEVELYRDVIGYTCLVHDLRKDLRKQQQLILQARLTSLGELVAGIAHEINNAVNFINATLPQMEREINSLLDEQQLGNSRLPRQLARCREGSRRTTAIVRSLKSFAHPGEGEMVEVDLRENVSVTLALLEHHYRQTIEIEYVYQEDLPNCVCHSDQMNQVLMNLLHNAMQAIEGEGKITIRMREKPRNWLHIQIQDSGSGMSEEVQSRIFDPFFTTKPQGVGTGMGLSMTLSVIASHGGKLAVNSKLGKGTTFFIDLPLLGCELEETHGD